MPIFKHGANLNPSLVITGIGGISPTTSSFYMSSSNSLTASNIYFSYFDIPINTGTVTNAATVYIAGAPTGGTITNPYALNVAAGTVRIGGTLQFPTGASNGYILSSDTNGNASWIAPSVASFTGFADGTVSAPGAYFISETNTGFYRPGSGQIYVSLAGANSARFTTTATSSLVSFNLTGIGSSTFSSATAYINPTSTSITGASAYYFTYLAAPITIPTSFTGIANTLFIAGAPTSTTGGTGYALNIASGNVILSNIASSLIISNVTNSTNSTTGALQVAGGAYFGGNTTFNANMTITGTSSIFALTSTTAFISLSNTSSSTSSSTGALQVAGGAYFGSSSTFATNLTLTGTSSVLTSNFLIISGTTQSTSSTTGSLTTAGGVGISKNIWLGSQFTGANTSIAGSVFNIPSFTYTTSTSNQADLNIATINKITLNGTGTATNAASLYIVGPPISGTLAITNPYALQVASGNSLFLGNLIVGTGSTGAILANVSNSTVSFCGYNSLYFGRFLDTWNDTSNQRLKLSSSSSLSGLTGLIILNENSSSTNAQVTQVSLGVTSTIRNQIDMFFYYVGAGSTSNKLQFGFNNVSFDQFNIQADGSTNVTGMMTISAQPYYSVKGGTSFTISYNSDTSLTLWTGASTIQGSGITFFNGNAFSVSNAGIYVIKATIYFSPTGGGVRLLILLKNASADRIAMQGSAGGSSYTYNEVSIVTKLNASDYVYLLGYQDSGGNLTVGTDPNFEFTIYRVS